MNPQHLRAFRKLLALACTVLSGLTGEYVQAFFYFILFLT